MSLYLLTSQLAPSWEMIRGFRAIETGGDRGVCVEYLRLRGTLESNALGSPTKGTLLSNHLASSKLEYLLVSWVVPHFEVSLRGISSHSGDRVNATEYYDKEIK